MSSSPLIPSQSAWQFPNKKLWHRTVAILLSTFFFVSIALPVHAGQKGVSLESFKVVATDPGFVEIELVGSNDGSLGPVFLGATAKSKDGVIRSAGFRPTSVPVGQKVHFSVQVNRPGGREKQQTEFLAVLAYPSGGHPFLRNRFDWKYTWPAVAAPPPGGAPDSQADLSAEQKPWQILYENLEDEDFAALDLLMEEWNNPKERNRNGEWKLDDYRGALNYASDNNDDWGEKLQRIQKWKKFNPKSAGAAIAEARHWVNYAWHIRGCLCIADKDVDPVAMRVFGERMKRAEKVLLDSRKFASGNPLWYETYVGIAIATKRGDKFIEGLFEEGVRRHPYFQPLYATMADHWAPRGGGKADWKKVDELVNRAVNLTSDTDGQGNYAWLYAEISSQQKIEVDILEDSLVSWPKMRDSFEELIKRYPSADNLNEFAAFACRARDKETFLNLSVKIQGRIVDSKWPSNYSIDLCNHRFMQYS